MGRAITFRTSYPCSGRDAPTLRPARGKRMNVANEEVLPITKSNCQCAGSHGNGPVPELGTDNIGTGNTPTLATLNGRRWDGWNIIREIQWPVASGQWPVVTDNVWGLDLDGTLQGAGGVGGLLAVVKSNSATNNSPLATGNWQLFLPTYDANGNITEYVTTNGKIVAHYDYSPFGETLIESGDLASTFTHRFSTKPRCPVTGLYEYQMRKYRPEIGRWLSRDPIWENGGENLYLAFGNSIVKYDPIGLISSKFSCCLQDTITDGKNFLIKLYEEKKEIMVSEGIPHFGTGDTTSCNAVNSKILDHFLNSGMPKSWACTLATRWRMWSYVKFGYLSYANHTVVLCRSYDTKGKEVETIMFDYWGDRPAGEDPATWFYSRYDIETPPNNDKCKDNHIYPNFQPIWERCQQ